MMRIWFGRSVLCVFLASCGDAAVAPAPQPEVPAGSAIEPFQWTLLDTVPGATALVKAIVRDGRGEPLAGIRVGWSVQVGGGMVQSAVSQTNENGIATQQWTLGPPGIQRLDATVPGLPTVRFEANTARVPDGREIVLDTIVSSGLMRPLYVTAPAGDARLFIVEQTGRIRVFKDGVLRALPFLDLQSKVLVGSERGLLGLAFHPDYATNGYFFVNYTDAVGATRIERYYATPGADVADAQSVKLILSQPQPGANHNGGQLLFGPGNHLFIPLGDGGGQENPASNGQNPGTLLGKLLRINVDVPASLPYAVPQSNPFVGHADARPEIWALGLRNPWRAAIDSGFLYIADVGQSEREEVNVASVDEGGVNYGWRIMEGSVCRSGPTCDPTGLRLPVLDYAHTEGCSIIGGFVYRGAALPEIDGVYFYSDFCSGWIRSFRYVNGAAVERRQWTQLATLVQPTSFGLDGHGELYITTAGGIVARFARRP